MRSVVLLLLGAHLAYAVMHSHEYIYTATSGIADFPEFVVVGMVDGQQVNYFDSQIMKVVPRTDWVSGAVDPEFWNRNGQIAIGQHQVFKNNIEVAKQRFNQTGGVHTVQLMYGCEQDNDGSTRGYFQYGYDGEDFLSLDKSTLTWTAANPQAVITKHKLEATGADANYWKGYLENTCIEWVQKYVGYGKDTLDRKVSPQVSLLQKSSSSSVTCHATGFYPSGVTISWMKNGREHLEDVDLGELLPNEDGTFQKTSTIRVTPEEWKNNQFRCVVEHQGETKEEKEIRTNEGGSVPIMPIFAVLVAVVLLIAFGTIGYVVYKKKQDDRRQTTGFKPVNTGSDDGSSNNSAQPQA